jgi:hypothetical protein
MSTFSAMRARIADKLNRNDLTAQINDAINRAITKYSNSDHFWFNETSATYSTVVNQESYGVVDTSISNIKEIDYVKITLALNDEPEVYRRVFDEIQTLNRSRNSSDPVFYAYYQEKFYFSPIPNAVKTITVFYTKSYTDLSADADTNDFTTYAEDLIESDACEAIYADILKDQENAMVQSKRKDEALRILRIANTRKSATDSFIPTYF